MVVKKTNESGGYGMLMGHAATDEEIRRLYKKKSSRIQGNLLLSPLSACQHAPCYINGKVQPRRMDLRPFALCGPTGIEIVPGGLTRVALREGSLVVNSSQGGGSKDTWVLAKMSFNIEKFDFECLAVLLIRFIGCRVTWNDGQHFANAENQLRFFTG